MAQLNRKAIQASSDMISAYDPSLRVSIWNRACEERFRVPASQAIGRPIVSVLPYLENDHRVKFLEHAVSGKTFFFQSMPFLYSEGFYTQLILPLEFSKGEYLGVLNIMRRHEREEMFSQADLLSAIVWQVPQTV